MNTRPPESQVGLASWLGGGSIFIVLLAVAAIAVVCAALLGHQVSQQALVRAQLAVTSARDLLTRDSEDLLSDARDLADRPALARLLADSQAPSPAAPAPAAAPAAPATTPAPASTPAPGSTPSQASTPAPPTPAPAPSAAAPKAPNAPAARSPTAAPPSTARTSPPTTPRSTPTTPPVAAPPVTTAAPPTGTSPPTATSPPAAARPPAKAPPAVPSRPNPGLRPFLIRYTQTTNGDTAALLQGTTAIASSARQFPGPGQPTSVGTAGNPPPPLLNWPEIARAIQEQGERFVVAPRNGGPLIWGAAVPVPGTPITAVTLRLATPALLATLGRQVGATLQLVNFATYHAPPDDDMTPLHSQALGSAQSTAAAGRLRHGNAYAASLVLSAQTGEVVGLLDARVSGADFSAAQRGFDRVLLITALLVATAAGLLGLLYGRWLARPVVALRDIAERIGRGDFSAAVPAVAPLEVGALARSMDEMRRRLVDLTDALRRREAEAQAVLAGVVEGVFAVDDQRRIRYANSQVARLLRRSPAEISGQFCGDVLRPAPVNGVRPCEHDCPILAARNSTQASAHEMLCLPDGATRSTIVLSAPPIQGIQVQILRDETDLEAARRARDSVLGNISHEFRTPLAAQLASIELLRDGLGEMRPEAQHELLANVERGVLRLMRLIDNLLESVRIEAGQLSIRQQPVQLAQAVAEAHDLIAPLLRQRSLRVHRDADSLEVTVLGDAQRLVQVFVNLFANAAKFAPDGSLIRVGANMTESRQVEVWVEDEGPGIPADSSSAIFERFQRGAGTEPEAPGLGLGLWIVKSIAERHGGSVRVERTAEQRTRFLVLLPLAQPTPAEPSHALG